jgi:hypothetical protein
MQFCVFPKNNRNIHKPYYRLTIFIHNYKEYYR